MAKFELTRELIDFIRELIEQNNVAQLTEILLELHPADIAEIYEELSVDEAKFLYFLLDDDTAAEVLINLEEDDRQNFLKSLPSEEIARRFIDNLDTDDAADIISEMDEERQKEVLSFIDDTEVADDIADLLSYEEDTAGSLMAKELIKVRESWNIITCLRSMRRQVEEVDEVYFVYVVDDKDILKGTISLKRMLLASSENRVRELYNPDVISVNANTHSEEVANIMGKYDLVVLPVVDDNGKLLGRITIDDVVDYIREEAEKDYQLASGITGDVEISDSVWRHTRVRVPWLMIGMMGGLLGSRVISAFEGNIARFPEVTFFMPLIGAMGGNVGIQSSAIIVQSIASGNLGFETNWRKLGKEVSIALLNASALSVIAFIYNMIVGSSYALTFTVTSAMFSVVLFASLLGTFLPLLLNKFKVDPAVATGPFITTLNDIVGMFLYLILSVYFFNLFM